MYKYNSLPWAARNLLIGEGKGKKEREKGKKKGERREGRSSRPCNPATSTAVAQVAQEPTDRGSTTPVTALGTGGRTWQSSVRLGKRAGVWILYRYGHQIILMPLIIG